MSLNGTHSHGTPHPSLILDPDLLIALTGARACGKSVILKLLAMLYGPEFLALESSGLCDDHIRRGTRIGQELATFTGVRSGGGFYPDDLIIRTTLQSIEEEKAKLTPPPSRHAIRAIGLAGGFRTESQRLCFGKAGYRTRSIHICSTLRQVFEGVVRRKEIEGQTRDDVSVRSVVASWHNYGTLVRPGMESAPADEVCTIHKSHSLLRKMIVIVRNIDRWTGTQGLINLVVKDHPVRLEMARLEKEWANKPVTLTQEMEEVIADDESNQHILRLSRPLTEQRLVTA
ncbi:MAG: hypothetical protein AAB365_01045 [Patescibacteria group bacterium]